MTEQRIEAAQLLSHANLIGGDMEYFWHPDFSPRGSHTHRFRIAEIKDGKDEIIFECKWVARWNKKEKVWKIAKRRPRQFSISKEKPEFGFESLTLRDDGTIHSFVMGCPIPPQILSSTTFYPKGHLGVIKEADVRGL